MTEVTREYRYQVDRDGRVFHDGTEIVDPAVLRFFLRAMTRTEAGACLVLCQGERNWFEAADTPFVIQRLGLSVTDGRLHAVELRLAGDYREPLDPATLEHDGGRLCCRVRKGAFRARFGRIALQQLAPWIVEEAGRPALELGGLRYPLSGARATSRP